MGSTVRIQFQPGPLLALTSGKSHISLNLSFLICKMGSVCLGMGAPLLTSLLYSLLGRGCLWSVLYSDWGEAGMLALLCPKGFENSSPGPTLCVVTFLVLVST